MHHLTTALQLAAALQLGIALLNLALPRALGWREDLAKLPLLVREVFQVHLWFISVTLTIFAVMTWRFAAEMAHRENEACRWLAAAIGAFWGIRTILQITYYSGSHWRGRPGRTTAHILLLLLYGGFACIYFWSAFGTNPQP